MTQPEREFRKEVFGAEYFTVDRRRCALLVIDMQNSFVAEGAVFMAPHGREILPQIGHLVDYARANDMAVIWTQSDHSPPGGGLILDRYPIIKHTRELWKGDMSFDLFPDMVQPTADEHRIVKHKYDAFHDTDLDTVLKNLRCDTVIISGVASEVCCESTARAAFFHEYKVVFVRDATAAFNPDLHDLTCERIDALFGRVIGTQELVNILEDGEE